MKKFFSVNYSSSAFNITMLLLRLGAGSLLMSHGYDKLIHFSETKAKFINFLGIGSATSLTLVIFAEVFCAMLVIIGLFSRLVVIPIIFSLSVALFKVHHLNVFTDGEKAALFLTCFIPILLCGPGKISVDGMMR